MPTKLELERLPWTVQYSVLGQPSVHKAHLSAASVFSDVKPFEYLTDDQEIADDSRRCLEE